MTSGAVFVMLKVQGGLIAIRLFNLVYSVLVFPRFRRGLLNLCGCEIGKMVGLHDGVRFTWVGRLKLGDHSTVNPECFLDSRGGLTIGRNTMVGRRTSIYTMTHDVDSPSFAGIRKGVKIGDDVVIFPHVLIMPGVEIGNAAIIYPGAVVTHNVSANSIIAGVPGRVIGVREKGVTYTLDYTYAFGNA